MIMSDSGSIGERVDFRVDEERPSRDVIVFVVRGEADLRVAEELRDRLEATLDDAASGVVVDLTHCSFIDSVSLSMLAQEQRRLRSLGSDLRLVVPPTAAIRRIFELTMLDRVFVVEDTRQRFAASGTDTRS